MKYRHIEYKDRRRIAALKSYKLSVSEIARRTGFSKSTISRELKRNGYLREFDNSFWKDFYKRFEPAHYARVKHMPDHVSYWAYDSRSADVSARWRRTATSQRRLRVTSQTRAWIAERLREGWSPQQIAGRSRLDGPQTVSHEYIYQLIIKDKKQDGRLYRKLKRFGKRKRRINERDYQKSFIPGRVPIHLRPSVVDQRARLGDLEGDLIVGKNQKSYIVTLVDRKSRQIAIERVKKRDKLSIQSAFLNCFKKFPKVHTLTLDNAREFSCHLMITKKTGVQVFFANPYASHERGSIENANGLLRYYLPKRTDFRRINEERLQKIEGAINSRPRKVLNYLTANEIVNNWKKQSQTKDAVALQA